MIQPFKKGKDICVMIWGAIYGNGRSDIVFLERDPNLEKLGYTANSYLTILREQIPRTYEPGRTIM